MTMSTSHAFRLKMAKQKAENFFRQEGITTLPTDRFDIAASRDIAVNPKPDTAGGVSATFLRHGDMFRTEPVIGLGDYGETLTVLTCPTVQDETYRDDEGDDDEGLAERRTPRFRR